MRSILYSVLLILVLVVLYGYRSATNVVALVVSAVALGMVEYRAQKSVARVREGFQESPSTDAVASATGTSMVPYQMDTSDLFVDRDFKENIGALREAIGDTKGNLVFYVSTFDKQFVHFDQKTLQNHVSNDITRDFLQYDSGLSNNINKKNSNMDEVYHQTNGLKISSKVVLPDAKFMLESFDKFTIFIYLKMDREQIMEMFNVNSPDEIDYSLLKFDHHNVINDKQNYKLFEIVLKFLKNKHNPNIDINIGDTRVTGYTYRDEELFQDKMLYDNKFHLLTLVKGDMENEDGDATIMFYLDDKLLIPCGQCFSMAQFKTYNSESIGIRDSGIRINDNEDTDVIADVSSDFGPPAPGIDSNVAKRKNLEFRLNALGVIRKKALNAVEVKRLYEYFSKIKSDLSPEMHDMYVNNRKLQKEVDDTRNIMDKYKKTECPFSAEVCESRECRYINNWENINELVDNPVCFQKLNAYCDSLGTSIPEKQSICKYIKSDNIGKMARVVNDTELFRKRYNEGREEGHGGVEGGSAGTSSTGALNVRDINLDSTFRDGSGRFNSEMHRKVNEMLREPGNIDPSLVRSLRTTVNVGDNNPNRDDSGVIDVDTLITGVQRGNKGGGGVQNSEGSGAAANESFEKLKSAMKQIEQVTDLSRPDAQENPYQALLNKYEADTKAASKQPRGALSKFLNGWF